MTSTTTMYTDDLSSGKPQGTSGSRQLAAYDVRMGNTHVSTETKHRGGSPRPGHPRKGRLSVMRKASSSATSYPGGYNPNVFTITAYLPYDGGKRLKLQCSPGQTVQQVIETVIPELVSTTYQVYQFPSRALLNPEKDASVLQDQEISIEPLQSSSPDDIGDDRLAIVRELLKTEDTYLENLRNIFDIYMEPLKKWGLPQAEMNTMFRSLSRLCDLLMNFFSELELAVQHWNTHSTRIGGLFKQYRSFWEMYKEYSTSYTRACKLLKDKRAMDDSFSSFLELKRGAAMHTLESLMLLPVHRIHEYHKLLVQLCKITPKDHVDYSDLKYTVSCVSAMVQEREEHLMLSQNKVNLVRVQSRFPNDNLRLLENDTPERRSKSMSHSPSTSTHMAPKSRKSDMIIDTVDSGALNSRLYLTEGPVRIISGMQSHERFFFLFDDMLIIGKPVRKQKAQHKMYKRKEQLRLSEMWVTDCVDEVMECTLPPDTAFVIGWPITNCLAAFSTPQEKVLWYNQLSKNILTQREAVKQDTISVQVVNRTKSSNNIPVMMHVQASETAKSVLLRAVEVFAIAVASTNCQLWVQFSKDDSASPLIGHEHPFAIQMFHNRQQLDYMDSKPVQLQFVIKRRSAVATDLSAPRSGLRRQKFSLIRLVQKGRKRPSASNKKGMFKVPLERIIVNDQLPEILQEMLIRLFKEAPQTLGIFRQSANYRKVKDLKEAMDNGERVDLSNVSIHVIGALLKELLRSVPGGILMSTRYTEFVATNDIKDINTRVLHLKKVISKLPPEHQLFLRYLFPLLHHISTNEEVNCMNTINLAICFAPSLLWPDSGLDVVKNEVPPLVQFMTEHSPKIFGTELPELYKQVLLPQSPGVENMEFSFEPVLSTSSLVPTKMEDGSESSHKRTESVDSSQSEDSLYHKNSLIRAKRNGLTLSDSQLSTISQNDYEGERPRIKRDASVRESYGHQLGVPRNKRVKKVREPKRSSSLQGPSDLSTSSRQFYDRKQIEARRRSIADHQLPVKKLRADFIPGVQTIPDSPAESQSSSQDYQHSAYMLPRAPQGSYYPDRHYPYDSRHEVHRHSPQKKRRVPQHSNSFSKGTENKPAKPMASSASWYDRLLPLDSDAKIKSRSTSLGTRHPLADDNREQEEHPRFRVGSGPIFEEHPSHSSRHYVAPASYSQQHVASNQSVSSSRSGSSASSAVYQSRQSGKPSLAHSTTNTGGSQGSPDIFAQLETTPFSKMMDKEFLKVAISKRFDLKDSQDTTPPTKRSPPLSTATRTSYYTPVNEAEIVPVEPSSADSLSKMERKRANSTASIVSESSFSKSHSYQSFLSSQQKKDSQMSLVQAGLDDRPESDQHLHSLPRPHTAEPVRPEKVPPAATMYPPPTATMYPPASSAMYPPMAIQPQVLPVGVVLETVPDQDTSKLYPSSSGYNSDTESSPSRTLSRPGKILEVTSPNTTLRMPPRYKNRGPQYYHQPPSKQVPMVEQPVKESSTSVIPVSTAVPVTIPQSTNTTVTDPPKEEPPMQPLNKEAEVIAAVMDEVVKKKPVRPKSGDSSKIGQLVKTFSKPDLETNLETGKVKLGLIPPRQRSKSTSEKEVMRILHKVIEEDETPARTAEEEERAEKHKAWASSAPTTADRKKAWESLSQDQFKRAEARSRSLKHEQTPVVEKVTVPKPSMTPEMKRKSATMPDYLVTGSRRLHGSVAQIRTYKVVSYNVPEPERIRRINLRTYH